MINISLNNIDYNKPVQVFNKYYLIKLNDYSMYIGEIDHYKYDSINNFDSLTQHLNGYGIYYWFDQKISV